MEEIINALTQELAQHWTVKREDITKNFPILEITNHTRTAHLAIYTDSLYIRVTTGKFPTHNSPKIYLNDPNSIEQLYTEIRKALQ